VCRFSKGARQSPLDNLAGMETSSGRKAAWPFTSKFKLLHFSETAMTLMRQDIQALRGLAVALVVLDHIGIQFLKNGYLGVDIFFVISGFLITGIIARKIKNNDFSFSDFYLRRARRLLPSALATIVLTSIGSVFFLNSIELADLQSQVIGALTFSINFVLWGQTGYFDVAASFKPLLHLWSLAVEEQFYLILPFFLIYTPRRYWPAMLGTLIVISLAVCIYLLGNDRSAAFYLLPSRAWELLLGSAGALIIHSERVRSLSKTALIPSIVALIAIQFVSTGFPHPGLDALIVCTATLIIILSSSTKLNEFVALKPLARLGDISYPLYLVHWPIIVFLNSSYIGPIPIVIKVGVVALSVVLAIVIHHWVETPLRSAGRRPLPTFAAYACTATAVLGLHFAIIFISKPEIDFVENRIPNTGLDRSCDSSVLNDNAKCKTSASPKTLVWGDSYAMHLVPGLATAQHIDLRQATFSACPPFLGVSPYNAKNPNPKKTENCINFNDSVLQFVKDHKEIDTVIIAASFAQHANPGSKNSIRQADGKIELVDTGLDSLKSNMRVTVEAVRSIGKDVVVISSTPGITTQNLLCMERTLSKKIVFGENTDCNKSRETYDKQTKNIRAFYEFVEKDLNTKVVKLSDTLCDEKSCVSIIDRVPIYRDEGHLSKVGSIKIFEMADAVIN
jgi:peptidoglycan/LPS O-acetylase OafA/YrhL